MGCRIHSRLIHTSAHFKTFSKSRGGFRSTTRSPTVVPVSRRPPVCKNRGNEFAAAIRCVYAVPLRSNWLLLASCHRLRHVVAIAGSRICGGTATCRVKSGPRKTSSENFTQRDCVTSEHRRSFASIFASIRTPATTRNLSSDLRRRPHPMRK